MVSVQELVEQLQDCSSKFTSGRIQVARLDQLLEEIDVRLVRAEESKYQGQIDSLRMRVAVIEGVRRCYMDYCNRMVRKIAQLDHQRKDAALKEKMKVSLTVEE